MSKVSPRRAIDIAEHSMCQPGRPGPQGDSQEGSPSLAPFHSAKSPAYALRSSISTRAPASRSSGSRCESLPYSAKRFTEKNTSRPLSYA